MKIFSLGNTGICVEFSQEINEYLNEYIVSLAAFLEKNKCQNVIEIVSAYSSITVFYELTFNTRFDTIKNWIEESLLAFKETEFQAKKNQILIQIPTVYDGEDINFVAELHGMTTQELIFLHTNAIYRVYMMGFLPGFAYLGGLNERLATLRRATPRLRVPSGSVGIGGLQTGIYPCDSPGGWQLIGRTDLKLFSMNNTPNNLLKTGDLVKFIAQ